MEMTESFVIFFNILQGIKHQKKKKKYVQLNEMFYLTKQRHFVLCREEMLIVLIRRER